MGKAQPDLVPESDETAGVPGESQVSRRTSVDPTPVIVPLRPGDGQAEPEIGPPPEEATDASQWKIGIEDLNRINTRRGLIELFRRKRVRLDKVLETIRYQEELEQLQVELGKMQRWIRAKNRRLAVLFEGRDAAGKGGAIRRFAEHLNPRAMRVVALPVPTEEERGQWYFQRYSRQLPNPGEIVLFDRSWYNRAVVEPVNEFSSTEQYQRFMQQVPEYEHMLYEDGIIIVKFWFSISKKEQLRRFKARHTNPLKQWKISAIDEKAQNLWDLYSHYKKEMFIRTHTSFSPWIIVRANEKKRARLESIRYVLNLLPYPEKDTALVTPDPNVLSRYHRAAANLD